MHNGGGPYFDDLTVGQVFDAVPAMTLSAGAAAVHQSILGDRLRLSLDGVLAHAVTGAVAPLAHPALVCDVAIGQSTLATQRVKANLFYRGLVFHRFPVIGDTLYTRTEVVGLRANSIKPGRAPTGLAALRMTTIDQADQLVLDFYRCAMLPASPDWSPDAGRRRRSVHDRHRHRRAGARSGRRLGREEFRRRVPGPHFDPGWRVRYCTAPPTWSPAPRSWLASA
ncbi:Beta-methylmalyl-CoA dehydratase [Mycobacterium talmoniae]|uniref:Beta-methylmalyl-CoA dehydratase n=1 Tax=Mycobacterium talmoniae TaxID=1858794 RepID=A0A2S8BHL8_9MYCO|nr:Beta-methylmalyl-CoA dehydratase [Mycobacterium talmoniae]